MEVRLVGLDALPACLAVRHTVFIEEQQVPADLEVDGLDPEALHVLATDDAGRPVGTARMRVLPGARAKVERVAVLADQRGTGLGARLMDALEGEARRRGLRHVDLSAQVPVLGFYAARGYAVHGPEFMDAGIPHRKMTLELEP